MSIQWTLIATCLYTELAICTLLLLPFISAKRWRSVFRSRIFNWITSHAHIYFSVFAFILFILFLDSVRDVRNYSNPASEEGVRANPIAETALHMKMFRAQRNFYIAGFALFLFMVLRRLVVLLSHQATLMADCEAAQSQATSASEAAKRFMEQSDSKVKKEEVKIDNKQLDMTREEIEKLKTELNRSKGDRDAMKKQADSVSKEFDRLLKEHAELQEKLEKVKGSAEEKKTE